MSEILNVEEIIEPEKVLTIGGERHVKKVMTVEEVLTAMKAEKDADNKEKTPDQVLEGLVDAVSIAFPTVDRENLLSLSITQVTHIIKFINAPAKKEDESGE